MRTDRKQNLVRRKPDGTKERSVMIVDALVRLGSPLGSHPHYRSVANAFGVSYKVVRNAHEAWWPLCERWMEVDRQNAMMKAERDKFFGMASPPPETVEAGEIDILDFLSRPKVPTEADNFDKALETLKQCLESSIVDEFRMPVKKKRKTA